LRNVVSLAIVMRRILFLLCLAATCLTSSVSSSQSCEPTPFTRKVLEQLQVPDDAHLPAAQRQEVKLGILRKALSVSPADIFLNEAYQSVSLAGMEVNRPPLMAQYDALVEKHPDGPVFLYLAANAETGRDSKQAIAHLQRAIKLAPSFGLPHLLLAGIYLSRIYEDAAQMNDQLEGFAKFCPSSVRALPNLRWSKDKDLLKREATLLRRNIEAKTDSEAVAAYPILWSFEAALERSDQQSGNQLRMQHDIDRLRGKQFVRNSAWLDAIESAGFYDGIADDVVRSARHEIAVLYPNSDSALHEKYQQAIADAPCPKNGTAEQNTACARYEWRALVPLVRDWPATPWLADIAARAVIDDRSATPEELTEVITLFENASKLDPDGNRTSPPEPIWIAQQLVERGGPYDSVPDLVRAGFAATERQLGAGSVNDLQGATRDWLAQTWYLMGYIPLSEADIHLGHLKDADDALSQAEIRLQAIRPPENASSDDKMRFAYLATPYWFVRGMYAEEDGREADALVDYRNALVLYPPRRPSPDRRDEVMACAKRVWKEVGGTSEGWNDWASQSPLSGFYAGSGGSQSWSKLAESLPDRTFVDALGDHWNPLNLAKKTTFVTMWASWCAPCRAELPYLEKLYQRFKGREDVAILAFNIDDDPKAMTAALQELKVSIPSVAARDFAYSIVPPMALPANWIITPNKTEMFSDDSNSHEVWLENAAKAIEKAAAR
jgi:thiol-disulfide isomerase/thioredoxin